MSSVFRNERGEGRSGTMFALLVLGLAIYLGVKILPVMVRSYEFRDYLEEQARFASARNTDDEVRDRVFNKADELELPVKRENVKVNRTRHKIDINVKYTVQIETPVYTYDWIFNAKESAPLF